MGIVKRFKNLFGGMIHSAADKAEQNNPQWLAADAEEKIKKSRKEAEKQLIEIQTWTEMIRIDMKNSEENLNRIQDNISDAAEMGDKELLAELIMQEDEYKTFYQSRKELFDCAVTEAIRVRDNYKIFESRMNEKMQILKNIKSQAQLAEIRGKILELDEGFGNNSDLSESMEKLRLSVNKQSAEVLAIEQLRREKLDTKINDLEYMRLRNNALERAELLLASKNNT